MSKKVPSALVAKFEAGTELTGADLVALKCLLPKKPGQFLPGECRGGSSRGGRCRRRGSCRGGCCSACSCRVGRCPSTWWRAGREGHQGVPGAAPAGDQGGSCGGDIGKQASSGSAAAIPVSASLRAVGFVWCPAAADSHEPQQPRALHLLQCGLFVRFQYSPVFAVLWRRRFRGLGQAPGTRCFSAVPPRCTRSLGAPEQPEGLQGPRERPREVWVSAAPRPETARGPSQRGRRTAGQP